MKNDDAGFVLLELLIVLAVASVLAAAGAVRAGIVDEIRMDTEADRIVSDLEYVKETSRTDGTAMDNDFSGIGGYLHMRRSMFTVEIEGGRYRCSVVQDVKATDGAPERYVTLSSHVLPTGWALYGGSQLFASDLDKQPGTLTLVSPHGRRLIRIDGVGRIRVDKDGR